MVEALKGAVVLITRPAHLSDELAIDLRRNGATVIKFPTIEIESIADRAGLEAAFDGASHPDIGIFVSVNAVNALGEWLKRKALSWPAGMKCAAVGAKTAQVARSAIGLKRVVVPESGFGAKFLFATREMRNLTQQSVAVFEGEGGSGLVQAEIDGKCRILSTYQVYRINQPDTEVGPLRCQLNSLGIGYVVVASVAGARNLFSMLGEELSAQLSGSVFCSLQFQNRTISACARLYECQNCTRAV